MESDIGRYHMVYIQSFCLSQSTENDKFFFTMSVIVYLYDPLEVVLVYFFIFNQLI